MKPLGGMRTVLSQNTVAYCKMVLCRLSEKLEVLGVRVQPLLEGIGEEQEDTDLT